MLFVGTYEHSIDAKKRLAIPSPIRQRLVKAEAGEAMYAVVQDGVLCLYTEAQFEKRAEQLETSDWPMDELLAYEQTVFPEAEWLEFDKQGRVRLPERILTEASLDKEVTVVGVKDHLQVHDRGAWNARREQMQAARPKLKTNPRRALQTR